MEKSNYEKRKLDAGLCSCVDDEKTDTNYKNGLLLINIPLKDPWEKAYDVTIH